MYALLARHGASGNSWGGSTSHALVCAGAGSGEDIGAAVKEVPGWRPGQARPPMGRDPAEQPSGMLDNLPDWMGYGALYAVTLIPVAILSTVVAILFFSSLK
jgi:hypothetical protein